jgi:hypothetical protein
MKKILILALFALTTLAHADVITATCSGTLLSKKTVAFGGGEKSLLVTWKMESDTSTLTLSEGIVKMSGPIANNVATLSSEDGLETMIVKEIIAVDGANKNYLEINGQSRNSSKQIVSNVSGVLVCL